MRPVVRGPWPLDEMGNPLSFRPYTLARDPLIERIGDYCSYCEIPIPTGPDVEHIQPKSVKEELKEDWNNFLLGCPYCNSRKGHRVPSGAVAWPDVDNTFAMIEYAYKTPPSARVFRGSGKAQALIDLVGLDHHPSHGRFDRRSRDLRWKKRDEAWDKARELKADLLHQDTPVTRRHICDIAKATGFWSVWMTVFWHDEKMLQDLIQAYPGTWAGDIQVPRNLIHKVRSPQN